MSKLVLRCLRPTATAGQSRGWSPSTSSRAATLRSWASGRTDDARQQAGSLLVRQQRKTTQVCQVQLTAPFQPLGQLADLGRGLLGDCGTLVVALVVDLPPPLGAVQGPSKRLPIGRACHLHI
jgi:hypothetical protein